MSPSSRRAATAALSALLLLPALPAAAHGQLRPLDPREWSDVGFEGQVAAVGGGMYWGQRASLAGTEGLLVEVGSFRAVWGLGRVALEFAGTALWLFEEHTTFTAPAPDVIPAEDARRTGAGDYRVSTLVALTPEHAAQGLALRFGARLPTTDNHLGLDRDQTDFYALLLGGVERGGVALSGELGLGIFGTRDMRNEQVDVLLFGLSARHPLGPGVAFMELAGHHDTRAGPDRRGNEDLGEGRVGLRVGAESWVSVALVRGWTPSSPEVGFTLQVGRRF